MSIQPPPTPFDWPQWAKAAVTIMVAVILAIALLLLLPDASGETDPVPPSKWDEKLTALEIEAIEHAYKDHISHLFAVWMKDSTGQPARALSGARTAKRAFIGAMEALEKRAKQQ